MSPATTDWPWSLLDVHSTQFWLMVWIVSFVVGMMRAARRKREAVLQRDATRGER